MDGIQREYAYRFSGRLIIFGATFFGLASIILLNAAIGNDRGLIIHGIIRLGPNAATVLYWVLSAFSMGFVALYAVMAYHRLAHQQRLILGPSALTVPVSRWSRAEKEIAYRDIRELSKESSHGQQYLYITHAGGRDLIPASMLPTKGAFEEVCARLTNEVREAARRTALTAWLTDGVRYPAGPDYTVEETEASFRAWAMEAPDMELTYMLDMLADPPEEFVVNAQGADYYALAEILSWWSARDPSRFLQTVEPYLYREKARETVLTALGLIGEAALPLLRPLVDTTEAWPVDDVEAYVDALAEMGNEEALASIRRIRETNPGIAAYIERCYGIR